MLSFLFFLSSSVINYKLTGGTLTISGTGEITKEGFRSKGNYKEYERVIIEEGITTVEKDTFYECFKLEYVSIPSTMTNIGNFGRCCVLKEIALSPESTSYTLDDFGNLYTFDKQTLVRALYSKTLKFTFDFTILGEYSLCFGPGSWLSNVVIPSSVTTIKTGCFFHSYMESLTFGANSQLTEFGEFRWATINKIVLPKSITSIRSSGCSGSVDTLEFEQGSIIETIASEAFSFLSTDSVTLPDSVVTICENAFSQSTISSLKLGSKCTTIHITAFSGCGNLNDISFYNTNTHFTFDGGVLKNEGKTQIIFIQQNVESVTVESTITEFGKSVFQSASKLTSISISSSTTYAADGGALYSSNYQTLYAVAGGLETLTVNKDITAIDDYAACGCKKLTTFTIPAEAALITIGYSAFELSGITTFSLPSTVTTLHSRAFNGCNKLTVFNIPATSELSSAGNSIFGGSKIGTFFIPPKLKRVSSMFYADCIHLKTVTFPDNSETDTIGNWALDGGGFEEVTLPASLKEIEYEAFSWCQKLKVVRFKEGCQLSIIQHNAFSQCPLLEEVYLPPSLKTLTNEVFSLCENLRIVEHSLETISAGAFKFCSSLPSFNFTSKQTVPNPSAFRGCTNLMEFNVAPGNKNIKSSFGSVFDSTEKSLMLFPPGQSSAIISPSTTAFSDNAFAWCEKLKHVAFHSGSELQTIGEYTFFDCTSLGVFQFPPKLIKIMPHAFENCKSLKQINLPESLRDISSYAFNNCNSLKYVKYCGTKVVSGNNVFSSKVRIGVTEYYEGKTLCSIPVHVELSVDCERINYQITCDPNRKTFNPVVFFVFFIK